MDPAPLVEQRDRVEEGGERAEHLGLRTPARPGEEVRSVDVLAVECFDGSHERGLESSQSFDELTRRMKRDGLV